MTEGQVSVICEAQHSFAVFFCYMFVFNTLYLYLNDYYLKIFQDKDVSVTKSIINVSTMDLLCLAV